MTDSPDVYEQHCQRLHADEATPDEGTPDGDGGVFRTLPSGEVEGRPADQDWPPPGYRWNIDPQDRFATGGPQFTNAEHRAGGSVPKLEQIVSGPTHPSRDKRV